ncbi:MAG: hypothetical protein ACD_75C01657G0001 [uncultured bacterium]|nr:MAG: hypothetical protein ACD_75C01657G0001 [uncultured bacterium]
MVAEVVILFEACIVFFVNDDKPGIPERRKDCRPGPDNHFCPAGESERKLVKAFSSGQPRMLQNDLVAKA